MNNLDSTLPTKEERNWAMFCHLSSLLLFVGIPFGNIIGPLVMWLLKKDTSPYIDQQGKAALNFQISMTIYILISVVLIIILLGILMLVILGILDIILVVIAAIKSANGEDYRYPFTIQIIK
ncbi:MAG: DUF4870 domain-containing protein [Bacteroidota bacterium]